jgi:hypothetical protein
LFDQTTITTNGGFTANYNAYTTNVTNCVRLPPLGANDVLLSASQNYEIGMLGRFYLPGGSLLLDSASATNATNAALFGFHHYTTLTNNVPEGTNRLDISFHYVASTNLLSIFTPLDQDGDGIADWEEDKNGNGVYDAASGETDWKTYNSKLGVGTNGPGLITFTPLK